MKKIYIGDSGIEGKGLLAGEDIKKGDLIQRINGLKTKKVIKNTTEAQEIFNWIGTGKNSWINTDETPFRYVNHSCDPNSAIIGTKTVVATKDIKNGEEITMDYSLTDGDPHWEMLCQCNAPSCRKTIRSIQSVSPETFLERIAHIPRNFQRIYIRNHVLKTQSPTEEKQ